MKKCFAWTAVTLLFVNVSAPAATMISTRDSYMGAGTFYGPGKLHETPIFDVVISNMGFSFALNFITPFKNNGEQEPNICAEKQLFQKPTGRLTDGVTKINENVSACSFELDKSKVLVAIVNGGPHQGQQTVVMLDSGDMIITTDFALDFGKGGIVRLPFYGTTEEVVVPYSLQTQMNVKGGIDQAGSLKPGDRLHGRIGDFNHDGLIDGAIVVAGNMPLESAFMPGAPYALIRYFETDIPYDGKVKGNLADRLKANGGEPPMIRILPPGETIPGDASANR